MSDTHIDKMKFLFALVGLIGASISSFIIGIGYPVILGLFVIFLWYYSIKYDGELYSESRDLKFMHKLMLIGMTIGTLLATYLHLLFSGPM